VSGCDRRGRENLHRPTRIAANSQQYQRDCRGKIAFFIEEIGNKGKEAAMRTRISKASLIARLSACAVGGCLLCGCAGYGGGPYFAGGGGYYPKALDRDMRVPHSAYYANRDHDRDHDGDKNHDNDHDHGRDNGGGTYASSGSGDGGGSGSSSGSASNGGGGGSSGGGGDRSGSSGGASSGGLGSSGGGAGSGEAHDISMFSGGTHGGK
jgi:hypothetical protein